MFLVYYELLLREHKALHPSSKLFAYMDDIAFIAESKGEVQKVLASLTNLSKTLGLAFNTDKTEVIFWGRIGQPETIQWEGANIHIQQGTFT